MNYKLERNLPYTKTISSSSYTNIHNINKPKLNKKNNNNNKSKKTIAPPSSTGKLASKSWNEIDESWKLLTNVRNKIKGIEEKLNNYSNYKFDDKNLSFSDEEENISTNVINNRCVLLDNNNINSHNTDYFKMSSSSSNRKTFETSASTIQAGDPSILIHHIQPPPASSSSKLINNSKLIQSSVYHHRSILDTIPNKETQPDIKYLNEFSVDSNKKKLLISQQQHGSSLRLNTVDVVIPTEKTIKDKLTRKVKEVNSNNMFYNSSGNTPDDHISLMSKERASSMHNYAHHQQQRLEGNNNLFIKNRSNSEEPSSRYLHHEYFAANRILHRDSDLLPKETTTSSSSMNNFNDEREFYLNKLNKPAIITKRHLSTSNNQLSNNELLLTSNININNSNSVDPYIKPLNRKIAISNSILLQQKNKEESNDLSSSNLINLLPSSKLNINSIKYNINDNLNSSGKESKEQIIKRLKRTELLIGDTYAAQSGPSKLTSANTSAMVDPNNTKTSTGIITASSWRIGEVLAQKQLKDLHLTQKIDNTNTNDLIKLIDKENESKPSQSSSQQIKKPKRTECHLVNTINNSSSSKPQQNEQIEKSLQSSSTNNKSNKPYDLSDVHKYMQLQKTKRLYEIKNEKEKSKRDDEERKKKLQELYRKQRKQLLNNNNINPTKQVGSSSTTINNIFSLSIKNENNSIDKQSNDQDMSKMLHDKIVHLLNDNDKLVDKQIKNSNMASSNNSNTNKTHKFVSKRIMNNNNNKRVDFDTNKLYPLADEDNNNDNFNKSNGSGIQNIESSLDYSSSATITPNSSHLKYHQNTDDEPLLINNSREPINNNHTVSASYNKHDKHDRLKRICSMALELQTKLHQTKLKLFGYNPNEDSFLANNINQQTNLLASTKINDESSGMNGNDLKNIDDIFADSREKMILLESMFKDNLKEERVRLTNKINSVNSLSSSSSNSLSSDLPGIGNYSTKQTNQELTQDLAARKIQYAYRLYSMRRKYRNINKQLVPSNNNKKGSSKIKKDSITASNQAKSVLTSSDLNTFQADEYNFINIYRKRVTIESTTQKENENKSIKNNVSYTVNSNNNNLSTASNSSSTSSSSDSTSISKYISHSNKSKSNNLSRKISSKVDTVVEMEQVSSASSIESNSVVTSTVSKSSTSTSASSSSSSSTTITSSSSSTASSVAGTSENTNTKYSAGSKSNQIKPTLSNLQNKKISKLKQVLDERQEQKESRYSPSSLERMLSMGINYLDTLNSSALHLEELDKVRCIGLAQQETVALASLLKNQTNPIPISDIANNNIRTATSKLTAKSVRNESNNGSSLSSSLSSSSSLASSYNQLNEKENDQINEPKLNMRTNSIRKTAKKSENQDLSTASGSSSSTTANTVSDNTFERKNGTGSGIDEDEELEKSFRQLLPSESHIKKTKQDHAKSDVKDQSILMDLSHSSFYQNENNNNNVRLSFEDDSFKKFTGEIVKKYMQEEEMRSKHQAHLLKLREKALIDKTNAELAWLEQMKKKAQDKGEDEKMPSILKKEKGIIQKLKEEQDNINKMKEVQRKATENRLKILSQHSEVIKWCQNKLKKQTSNHLNVSSNNNNNNLNQDNTFDMSYNESEIDFVTTEEDDQHNQLDESNINQSLIESKLMKKVTHLNSEKYLTEREKKLRLRRKHAEEIIAWKKKLDDEELQVREIEKQANQVLTNKKIAATPLNDKIDEKLTSKEAKTSNKNAKNSLIDLNEEIQTESNIVGKAVTNNNEKSYSESFISTASIAQQTNNETFKSKVNKSTITQSNIVTQLDDVDEESTIKTNFIDDETNNKNNKNFDRVETPELSESISTTTIGDELETKVKQLKQELVKKKAEAEKLRQSLKSKEKLKLKEKEEVLRKKINSYDQLIDKIKGALENEQAKTPIKDSKAIKNLTELENDEESTSLSSSIKSTKNIKNSKDSKSFVGVGDTIKTETIYDNEDQDESITTSKSTLKITNKKKHIDDIKDSISTHLQITNKDESSTNSSSSTSTKPSTQSNMPIDDKYEDDFVNSIASLSKNDEKYDDRSSSSTSKSSASTKTKTTTESKNESLMSKKQLKNNKEELEIINNNKEDDLVSTASEISEEILGAKETVDNTATYSLKEKSKSKREDGNEEFDTEDEPTSSSSTDTQILLLNRKKAIDTIDQVQANEIITEETNLTEKIKQLNENEKLVNDADSEADSKDEDLQIELETKEDVDEQIEENNDLIESYEALLSKQTDLKETDAFDDELNNNKNQNNFRIHIPTIDLSNDDDDGSLQKTARINDSNDSTELDKKIIYKIPYTKEKIANLCDLAIEGYYWNQLQINSNLKIKTDIDLMKLKEYELNEFFQPTLIENNDSSNNEEVKNEKDSEIEFKFKRMLIDLIGELLLDLYIEKYVSPELVSELLPGIKRYPKRLYFKSIISSASMNKIQVKEIIRSKVLQLLRLDTHENDLANRKTITKSKWRSQKRLDMVDALLDSEMREQEHEWANYEYEEYEAKLLISNTIFDMLLKDAIDCFHVNYLKKKSSN